MRESAQVKQELLRSLTLNLVSAALSAVGALLIANNAQSWEQSVVLALGLVAALVSVSGWAVGGLSRVVLSCLAVAAAVWTVGVLVMDESSASYGLSVVGTIVVLRLPRHRRAAALGLVAVAVAVVAVRLSMESQDLLGVLVRYAVGSTSVAVTGFVLTFLGHLVSGLITELEESREREAELAVARERVRFAGDLHDIQGHTLHVVKLKVALARKLLHGDIDRVEGELGEVHALVGDTIAQTKELAYAQRRLNLSAELENAKNLFEAAGIDVRVDREAEVDARAAELLGQVLRETTTNILRHAQSERVRVTLSRAGIIIDNDGAPDNGPPELRGLSTLRERLEREGGTLTVEQKDGRFLTAATLPQRKDDR
ncbi:histidine kinase [Nocardiopsis sp. N85]|uniref:sensor histidine kinase n=1 Tax=Nocardiopsis sp. N85 TaxID=3029400 RepID=UPI00237F401E|nr:histidine kinase [Nocardiopsis sp. N85]MDE3721359.1 histidine kinase [Nocardiopsis sp. N85]